MALEENGMIMPVQPAYGGYMGGNGFGNFGGDWGSLIVLFLIAAMFGNGFGFGGGFGMGGMGGYDFPWLLTGQQNINTNTNAGFRDVMINDGINSIKDGINGVSTQLCNGFSDVQMALANGFAGVEQGANAREIANLQQMFAMQTANTQGLNALQAQLAQCCCENKAATQDVKYTIATEACATRANSTANTQAILDKLCQLELDGYKRENDQLRSQLQFANLQASQVDQTAQLRTSQATVANQLVAELRSCPIPSQPVYGNTPIFTCAQNVAGGCGCGCGNV